MRSIYYGDYNYMIRVDEQRNRRRARTRQVRRQKLILIGILVTLALVLFFSIRAFAKTGRSDDAATSVKAYKSVMIYCNDTVESIAEENFCYRYSTVDKMADEIRHINHLSTDEALIPGNYIVIPVCESSAY